MARITLGSFLPFHHKLSSPSRARVNNDASLRCCHHPAEPPHLQSRSRGSDECRGRRPTPKRRPLDHCSGRITRGHSSFLAIRVDLLTGSTRPAPRCSRWDPATPAQDRDRPLLRRRACRPPDRRAASPATGSSSSARLSPPSAAGGESLTALLAGGRLRRRLLEETNHVALSCPGETEEICL